MNTKVEELAALVRKAKHFVVYTGAGVSTACGVKDFRGPDGIWTLEEKGEAPAGGVPFEEAQPSLSHMALVDLYNAGILKYVISQNVDGLHLR